MLITQKILNAAPIKYDWRRLPNGVCIHHNVKIIDTMDIGDKTYIGDCARIWNNAHIGCKVRIQKNVVIDDNVVIGNSTEIGDCARIWNNAHIGERVRIRSSASIRNNVCIGNGAMIGSNAVIPCDAIILEDIKIYIIWLTYPAHYAGVKAGEHLFRLGCEIHPLSWFASRKRGYSKIDDFGNYQYNSGWARVWDANEMSEDEYRRYLRFFKSEARRLGI